MPQSASSRMFTLSTALGRSYQEPLGRIRHRTYRLRKPADPREHLVICRSCRKDRQIPLHYNPPAGQKQQVRVLTAKNPIHTIRSGEACEDNQTNGRSRDGTRPRNPTLDAVSLRYPRWRWVTILRWTMPWLDCWHFPGPGALFRRAEGGGWAARSGPVRHIAATRSWSCRGLTLLRSSSNRSSSIRRSPQATRSAAGPPTDRRSIPAAGLRRTRYQAVGEDLGHHPRTLWTPRPPPRLPHRWPRSAGPAAGPDS